MNWRGTTYTDSGGFQVMSLGAGFKKVISMDVTGEQDDHKIAEGRERLSHVDDDGVTFKSHLDGSFHRFTPEVSMQIQHQLGADIIFAFDELTTLMNTRGYQESSLERTRLWAIRCLAEHNRLSVERSHRPQQALWGVLQGAQYEDLRRKAARDLTELSRIDRENGGKGFGGYGIGGALEKDNLGTIVGWVNTELPENAPKHLLGISEPDDIFTAIENGADTFDCVSPTRVARNGAVYTRDGRVNITNARYRKDFGPIDPEITNYTSQYTRAYLHHLFKAKEGSRRRWQPCTTSPSSSTWSTGPAAPSRTATTRPTETTSSVATTPAVPRADGALLPADSARYNADGALPDADGARGNSESARPVGFAYPVNHPRPETESSDDPREAQTQETPTIRPPSGGSVF